MGVLILIPAWNEAATIGQVVTAACALGHDVLVIDDGSTDHTAAQAQAAGAVVLHHAYNLGMASALQSGYLYALERGYTALVQLDGDGQHDPGDIPTLLAPVLDGSADLLIGSRFLGVGTYEMPLFRRVGRMLLVTTLRWCGLVVSDPTSGFQAMNRDVAQLFATPLFPEDYPDADAILLCARHGFVISERGVPMYPNRAGKSQHNGVWQPVRYMLCMLLSLGLVALRMKLRHNKPPEQRMGHPQKM